MDKNKFVEYLEYVVFTATLVMFYVVAMMLFY